MKIQNLIFLLIMITNFSCYAQNEGQQMTFFSASETNPSGVIVFSTDNANLDHYYVNGDKWMLSETIKNPELDFESAHYQMQYLQGSAFYFPGLFIYGKDNGKFQFFYLDNGVWVQNATLPMGFSNLKDISAMEFFPGRENVTAYISVLSADNKQMEVIQIIEGDWKSLDFYPKNLN